MDAVRCYSTKICINTRKKPYLKVIDLQALCKSYEKSSRTLLSTAQIEVSEKGTLRVNTAYYTSDATLNELKEKEAKTQTAKLQKEAASQRRRSLRMIIYHADDQDNKGTDTAAELRRLDQLKPKQQIARERLR